MISCVCYPVNVEGFRPPEGDPRLRNAAGPLSDRDSP